MKIAINTIFAKCFILQLQKDTFLISELAFIAPETKKVLERLSHMPDVNVTVISGREMEDLTRKVNFGHWHDRTKDLELGLTIY